MLNTNCYLLGRERIPEYDWSLWAPSLQTRPLQWLIALTGQSKCKLRFSVFLPCKHHYIKTTFHAGKSSLSIKNGKFRPDPVHSPQVSVLEQVLLRHPPRQKENECISAACGGSAGRAQQEGKRGCSVRQKAGLTLWHRAGKARALPRVVLLAFLEGNLRNPNSCLKDQKCCLNDLVIAWLRAKAPSFSLKRWLLSGCSIGAYTLVLGKCWPDAVNRTLLSTVYRHRKCFLYFKSTGVFQFLGV